ncbi:MAG: tyrosine-type recombinase/integrase [Clostridia bacterium]|nr:tyrosine-type recombinase/integrase [Clostridia bacterium]
MSISITTRELTRLGYAGDLLLFFNWLIAYIPAFEQAKTPANITDEMLKTVTTEDIECFLAYTTAYQNHEITRTNELHGKARKLSAIRRLFQYLYERGVLEGNVAELAKYPKKPVQVITRLDPNEVADMLDLAEKSAHKLAVRDTAILTLFLGTGIRISELTGINIEEIDLSRNALLINRKGGKQELVYFAGEVEKALKRWLEKRKETKALPGHEAALFLSTQRRRITNRAVENLVAKYAKIVTPLKKISPHKLRSTFGTALYRETGDIYLVAEVLGHKDVNTTRRHYAAMDEERKIAAAKAVKLRED